MKPRLCLLVLFAFPVLLLPLRAEDQDQDRAKPQVQSKPASPGAEYVGSDTCLTCHEAVYKNQFEQTPHFQTVKKGHGCESCHGPGSEHVAGGESLKGECIRPGTPLSLEDAKRLIQQYVDRYDNVRLHSAIGYVTPKDMLAGRQVEIHTEGDRKLEAARQERQSRRQQAGEERSGQPPRCRITVK